MRPPWCDYLPPLPAPPTQVKILSLFILLPSQLSFFGLNLTSIWLATVTAAREGEYRGRKDSKIGSPLVPNFFLSIHPKSTNFRHPLLKGGRAARYQVSHYRGSQIYRPPETPWVIIGPKIIFHIKKDKQCETWMQCVHVVLSNLHSSMGLSIQYEIHYSKYPNIPLLKWNNYQRLLITKNVRYCVSKK